MTLDPTKHATVTSTSDEDLPSGFDDQSSRATTRNFLQKHIAVPPQPSAPRHRGHNHVQSLTLTRSQDGYTRTSSSSPERAIGIRASVLNGNNQSPMSSPVNITTPLLMPPPTTRMERVRDRGILAWYWTTHWLQHQTSSGSFLRLALLGIKLLSLSLCCWPYSSNLGVLVSVFSLAALDVWSPREREVMVGSRGSRGMVRVGAEVAGYEGAGTGANRWMSGWRRSCTLLALHCLVLWVTSRSGILCAASRRGEWTDW